MARKMSAAQTKVRKQKRIAIGLGAVFLVVCVVQVPKLMKQLNAKPPPEEISATSSAGTSSAAGTGTGTAAGALQTFSKFALKDPFHALVVASTSTPSAATPAAPPKPAAKPKSKPKPKVHPIPTKPKPTAGASGTVTFNAAQPPPNAAIFKTNGKRQVVFVGGGFPAKNPLFKLVALGDKTVRVGVFGGSFTSGVPTIKLAKGKRVTLANESDGSRYVIQLVQLTNATPPAASTTPAASAPATTTPATTTPGP